MTEQNIPFRLEQTQLPKQLDTIAPGGRIGVIALSTDFNLEQDLRRMLPPEVEIFTNRVLYNNPMTLEALRAMTTDIARAASGILPGLTLDMMIFGCTSATAAIGYAEIVKLIHSKRPNTQVITPLTSSVAALNAVGAKKISVLTPYIDEINQELGSHLVTQGFEVINVCGFGADNDIEVTMFPLDSIIEAANTACAAQADALFISCTALRASMITETLEQLLSIPVISSNQALAWQALQLLNNSSSIEHFGSLFNH